MRSAASKPKFRFAASLLGIAVIAAPLAAATPSNAADASDSSKTSTLKVAMPGEVDTLNPFTSIASSAQSVLALQYETLAGYDANNELVPAMANKWDTSTDGKVWTFHMPEGRKWSDDQPITAKDAEWTFSSIQSNDALKQANGTLVENVESVVAKDAQTLVMTLKNAQAPNPGSQLPIMPEHIWSKAADPSKFANDKDDVGSGPFVVVSYDKSAGVTMKANPNYRLGKAKVDGLIWVPYKNSDAAVQALKTGEVDVVGRLTATQFEALKDQPGITTNSGKSSRYVGIALNIGTRAKDGTLMGDGNPALQDLNLRKAILMGMDNKTLLDKVLKGQGVESTGEIPASYSLYNWKNADLPLKFNPDAANKLLDESGYVKGADGVRLDKTGKPLTLRLLGRNTDGTHQQIIDFVTKWLKNIGITVTPEMKSNVQVNDDSILGNVDMYFTGWNIGPDPDYQLSINQCSALPNADGTGGTSENGLCIPELDALIKAQHTELDQTKRSELVQKAQEMMYNTAAVNVLYYPNSLEAYRSDKFEPFATQPKVGGVITEQNGAWGYYSATPVGSAGSANDGGFPWVWVVVPVVIVILALIVFLFLRRRSSTADDRA